MPLVCRSLATLDPVPGACDALSADAVDAQFLASDVLDRRLHANRAIGVVSLAGILLAEQWLVVARRFARLYG